MVGGIVGDTHNAPAVYLLNPNIEMAGIRPVAGVSEELAIGRNSGIGGATGIVRQSAEGGLRQLGSSGFTGSQSVCTHRDREAHQSGWRPFQPCPALWHWFGN